MLSIGSVKSAGGAAKYYGSDDYYVSGEADKPGLEWAGEGSALAGLEGRADTRDFREVLQGTHEAFADKEAKASTDAGQHLGDDDRDDLDGAIGPERDSAADPAPEKTPATDDKKRPGWDFTFSAPKTVSVAILAGGDKALDRAHNKANADAMGYLERHFSVTRVRENGTVVHRVTGNLVYGSVVHGTSRAGDPDRHTHNVVANKTFDKETGKWRALETQQAYKYQQLLGMIYQGRMAKEGLEAGHNFKRGHTVGTFELAAWSKEEMRDFSQRREQIEKAIEADRAKTGADPSPARVEKLVLRGRPEKEYVQRSELVSRWNATAEKNGIDVAGLVADASRRSIGQDLTPTQVGVVKQDPLLIRLRDAVFGKPEGKLSDPYAATGPAAHRDDPARAAVSFAVRHLEQNSAVFDRHQVAMHALRAGPVGLTIDRVESQIEQLTAEKHLHLADRQQMGGMTTAFAVRLEQSIISKMDAGRNVVEPMLQREGAIAAITSISAKMQEQGGFALTRGQARASYVALTAPDKYVAIQGLAGTGKTTLFKTLGEEAERNGHEIRGLAATNEAAGILQRETGIASQTIESWLQGKERAVEKGGQALENVKQEWAGKTLLVDEASLVSNATMARIQLMVDKLEIRQALFTGDKGQIGSVEAGSPFRLLQAARVRTIEMRDIIRQRDKGLLRAVELAADHQAHKSIKALAPSVHQVGREASTQDLVDKAVDVWKAARAKGVTPAIVVNTNAMRNLAAATVRQELIKTGGLGEVLGKERRLYSARLTNVEAVRAQSYSVNQVVIAERANKALGLKRGEQMTLAGLDLKTNELTLRRANGQLVKYDLNQERVDRVGLSAYDAKAVEIRINEKMVWERTDKERGFLVGQGFTVLGREGDKWTIAGADGKQQVVTTKDLQFTGYGHAITADRRQGATSRHEIGIQDHREGQATTMARAYVQASRPTDRFDLITTDAKLLAGRLARQDGVNESALEHLREAGRGGLDAAAGLNQPVQEEKGGPGKGASPEGAEKGLQPHHQDREKQMAQAPQMQGPQGHSL